MKHYSGCTANYPEKKPGEKPQETTTIDIGNGQVVVQCNDCGAFEVQVSKPKEKKA